MPDSDSANRLGNAISPYLLQHADNPVDWWPWSPEALAEARRLDRPILLSVGYSACHWCHVMAHESFENERVAEIMNNHFVCIKVDREERPDLDRIYQLAHQLLTGRGGGWPLTVFLDPQDQAPFFAGTYFPLAGGEGRLGFPELLERIHQVWSTRRDELRAQTLQVQQALKAISQPRPNDQHSTLDETLEALVGQLASRFDDDNGGFGEMPKFPQAPLLALLLELAADDDQAGQMLNDTLVAMAGRGLHDHLAGGFFRYCTDAVWEIPHFEKMLADNAQLLGLYAEAGWRWKQADFTSAATSLVAWLADEMALTGGGFAASLDADSPDGEGAYYTWTPDQVDQLLDDDAAELVKARFGLDGPPNFEGKAWHLVIARGEHELVAPGRDQAAVDKMLDQACHRLLQARRERTAPGRDDKLIGALNGLALESLARAGRLLGRADWLETAAGGLDAVAVRLFGQEPPRAVWRDGRSAHPATLDDHAGVLLACLELLQWRFESRWFNLARRIARRIDRQFIDETSGAPYLTPLEHEPLITRPLALADDATPAGGGLAMLGLNRLGHLCGDAEMTRLAGVMLGAAHGDIAAAPMAHATLLRAALEARNPPVQVLLGGPADPVDDWHARLHGQPELRVYRVDPGVELEDPPATVAAMQACQSATAVVCSGLECRAPAHDFEALEAALAASR